MNAAVEKFKNAVAPIGYSTEEIRAKVRECEEHVIECAYNRAYWAMRKAMKKMSIAQLKDIVKEMEEGGVS